MYMNMRRKRYNHTTGQAALTVTIFFVFIAIALVGGFSALSMGMLRSTRFIGDSKISYAFAEGVMEDAVYRIRSGRNMPAQAIYQEGTLVATSTVTTVAEGTEVLVGADSFNAVRRIKTVMEQEAGTSFYYGVQVGNGGMVIENTASVLGNVYSNGPITGQNSNLIKGDPVSAGVAGLIDGVHATGTAYAHTISDSTIDKDAYYQIISNTSVGGSSFPGSPDKPPLSLPISDAVVGEWENEASASTISSPCPYLIQNDITLGPVHITCDVKISGDPTITLAGAVWIEGNLEIKNTAIIRISSSLGKKSIPIVVDNPLNRTTSSKAILENSVQFLNSGTEGSYILVVSQNNSAESGGTQVAIDVKNSANGDVIVYAGHGEITLQNSVELREVTAYKVRLKNSTEVIYEAGLANLLFESGPSGGWDIESWKEVQ